MAERAWTPEQRLAIDTRGTTLLVSAAAGSGKTAVLTERIINRLTDRDNPVDITELLVVTFTNAAVGELKDRIGAAIKAKVKENPADERLRRQLLLLPAARISTIDAFCGDILRANADGVGVSPAYRILDKPEAEILAEGILDSLIDGIYKGEEKLLSPEEFDLLAETLTDTKEQAAIGGVIRFLYEQTRRSVLGVSSLSALKELYNPSALEGGADATGYCRYILDKARCMAEHYILLLERTVRELLGFSGSDRIISVLEGDLAFLKRIANAGGYSELYGAFSELSFPSSPNKLKDPTAPNTTELRKELKLALDDFRSEYIFYTEGDFALAYEAIYKNLSSLVKIVEEFDRRFIGEKIRRSAFEYSDITRFTYGALVKDGERTALAIAESEKYAEIYIDEYQDVDSLQGAIFDAISKPDNRFMVGDIKQSIYCWRGAEPSLFAEMKDGYNRLMPGESPKGEANTIFMSDNFRCDKGVIDFVNSIFDNAFTISKRSVGYTELDRLNFSKVYPEGEKPSGVIKPEICVIDRTYLPLGEDTPSDMAQPYLVANKIKTLINKERLNSGELIKAGDIAIILRSAKEKVELYANALASLGIECVAEDDKDFFLKGEVLLALCLLNAIDNPERDIYLAGLMLSPLYSFTADDMVRIRKAGGESLYSSLKKYTEENAPFPKGERLIKTLDRYRAIAEGMPTDSFLLKLYSESGLLSLASKNGGKENLLLLYSYASSFEASSFKGLYNFIGYVNRIIERGGKFDNKKGANEENAVKIITAHSSKGLEYPVVFFAGAECEMVKKQEDGVRFLYKDGFGIGTYYRTGNGLALVRNPMRNAVKAAIEEGEFEEAERVLYVALTRARERLYVTAKARGYAHNLVARALERKENMSPYLFYNTPSFIEFIIATSGAMPLDAGGFLGDAELPESKEMAPRVEISESKEEIEVDLTSLLKERFSYVYPHKYLTDLPEKMSVSALYPTVLDGSDEATLSLFENVNKSSRTLAPTFVSGEDMDKSSKMGIATHKLMQFCDFDNLYKNGAVSEIERQLKLGFLTESDGALIRVREAELFKNSRLICEILGARKLWRELRFNLRLPAERFTEDEERKAEYRKENRQVLVQGVIDCLIEDANGELHLVDYKTDRLTPSELENKELASRRLNDLHSQQLSYYSDAVFEIFGKRPESVRLYSLPLGDTVDILTKKHKT